MYVPLVGCALVLAFAVAVAGADFELDGSLDEWADIAIHWSQPDGMLFLQWASDGTSLWIALGGARVESLVSNGRFELRFRLLEQSSANFTILSYSEGLCTLLSESWKTRTRTTKTGLQWKVGEGFEFCIPLGTVVAHLESWRLRTTLKIWDDAEQSTLATMPLIEEPVPMVASAEKSGGAQNEIVMASTLSEQGLRRVESLHSAAWEEMARKSATDPYYKYGLYASRSLAVAHPEAYLQADALFLDHIESNSGFAAAFAETDPDGASYYPQTFFSGPPFSLGLVDLDVYQTITSAQRLPSEVAAYGFLDQRLLSLASCLKDKDRRITKLEKATILYFKLREQSRERPFIVYCADETAYVASQGRMLSADGDAIVGKLSSDAILIFNEDFVWYPLMGRDDTARNTKLGDLVAKYGTEGALPTMSAQERRLAQTLRASTKLHSIKERDLARLAAVRGSPWVDPFQPICDKYLPNYPSDVWIFAIQQHWVHRANSISPWTSWLAAYVLDSVATDRGVEAMTGVWQGQLGMVYGYAWQCSLIRHTIDESVSVGAVHCVLHANCLSSVLDLAEVRNFIIQGSPGPPGKPNTTHTYVALPEVGMVLSNGEVTERGTVIDALASTLYYVSSGENWAFPYLGFYVGTWSPSDVALEFESIKQEYGNRFHGFRGGAGRDRFQRTIVVSEEFLAGLPSEQQNWHPFEHP